MLGLLVFLFSDIYIYDIICLQRYHAGHKIVIRNIVAHAAMIWGLTLGISDS